MKKKTFCPGWCYQPGQKVLFCPGCHPLLSRTGVSGWETGTTGVSQPGQINVFVVVYDVAAGILLFASRYFDTFQYILFDVANNNFLCCKRVFLMLQRTVQ